jgi:hypothetical protein
MLLKIHLPESRLFFSNVLEQWLKRYLFSPGENNCSCAVESAANLACAVDLHEKVAQLSFQCKSVQKIAQMAAIGQKVDPVLHFPLNSFDCVHKRQIYFANNVYQISYVC